MTTVSTNSSVAVPTNESLVDLQDYEDYYDIGYRLRSMMLTNPHDLIFILIGLVTVVLNLLVLLALHAGRRAAKAPASPHFQLVVSLAASDVVVGAAVMGYILNKVVNPSYKAGGFGFVVERLISKCTFHVIKALLNSGLYVTLLNLTAMAVDHYVAIMKPLQHAIFLRRQRVSAVLAVLWVVSFVLGFSDFLSGMSLYARLRSSGYNYCETIAATRYQEEFIMLAIAPLSFGVMLYIYVRIYVKVRKYRRPGMIAVGGGGRSGSVAGSGGRKTQNTRKALITTLLNLGTFIITWCPLCLFQITMLIQVNYNLQWVLDHESVFVKVDKYLLDLLMLNSIADSVIYTVRIREVKLGFSRMFPCCSRLWRGFGGSASSESVAHLCQSAGMTGRGSTSGIHSNLIWLKSNTSMTENGCVGEEDTVKVQSSI